MIDPPRWLTAIASIVLVPLYVVFVVLWMVHVLVRGMGEALRRWFR